MQECRTFFFFSGKSSWLPHVVASCFLALYAYLRVCERELEGAHLQYFYLPLASLTQTQSPAVDCVWSYRTLHSTACGRVAWHTDWCALFAHSCKHTRLTQYTLFTLGPCDFTNVQMEVMDRGPAGGCRHNMLGFNCWFKTGDLSLT